MAVPARLEAVAGKLGVMTPEHVVDPGPEQAQGRRALLRCGQVRPPDGPLAPGPGRLPRSQLTCQRGDVIEAGFQVGDSVPLRRDVLAEGAQLPVKPLILVELLRGEVIEVVFEFSNSVPLRLDVLAEGAQAPVKPLVLVELALLALAEVSQEPGQLACLSVEPCEVASTAAGGFMSVGRRPPIPAISWARAATSPLQGGRPASLMGWSSPAGVIGGCVMGWSLSPAVSCSLSVAPRRAGQDDDAAGSGRLPRPCSSWPGGSDEGGAEPGGCGGGPCPLVSLRCPCRGGAGRVITRDEHGGDARAAPAWPGAGWGDWRDRRPRFSVCHPPGDARRHDFA